MSLAATVRSNLVHVRRRWKYAAAIRSARVLVLRYHSVGEAAEVSRYIEPALSVSPRRFRDHVRLLARHYQVVVPDDLPALLADHSIPTRPAVMITFDDGYADNYKNAVPVLLDEGVRAVFFITTAPLRAGKWLWTSELRQIVQRLETGTLRLDDDTEWVVPPNGPQRELFLGQLTRWCSALSAPARDSAIELMARQAGIPRGAGLEDSFVTPSQLCEMTAAGMIIGAHTCTHPHLDLVAQAELVLELEGARSELEAVLNRPVRHLGYPNPGGGGTIQPHVRAAAARAGYATGFTSLLGGVVQGSDLLRLPRLGINAGAPEALAFQLLANGR